MAEKKNNLLPLGQEDGASGDNHFDNTAPFSENAEGGYIGTAFDKKDEANKNKENPLSDAPDLELLLYDSDPLPEREENEVDNYDSFLADYKKTVIGSLTVSREKQAPQTDIDDSQEDAPPTLLKQKPATDSLPEAEQSQEESDEMSQPNEESYSFDEEILEALTSINASETSDEPISEDAEAQEQEGGEQLELDLGEITSVEAPKSEDEELDIPTEDEKEDAAKGTDRSDWLHTFFEVVELFVFTLVSVMILTNFVFRHSQVEGGSMLNTLHDGDHLIISNLFYTPDYGDIVVFSSSKTDGKALIKRVVALEGDEVDFYFDDGKYRLFVNNELVEEDYVYIGEDGHVRAEVEDYVVKQGEVFVLGDHRNDSTDSRRFGAIDVDNILGRVLFRFYPFSDFGKVE